MKLKKKKSKEVTQAGKILITKLIGIDMNSTKYDKLRDEIAEKLGLTRKQVSITLMHLRHKSKH